MSSDSILARSTRSAVFLDRDGVINENRSDYVQSIEELDILPTALCAIARLEQSKYAAVIITNQSAIGRGLVTATTVDQINHSLIKRIRSAGGRIDGLYLCPHSPADYCKCRKPMPGMLLQAARELRLNLAQSWMIGDWLTDLQAASAAGVRPILVATGRGQEAHRQSSSAGFGNTPFLANIYEAVEYILAAP